MPDSNSARKMEKLNRGLVAVKVSGGVFISWRLLGNEDPQTTFNVYRNGSDRVNSRPLSNVTSCTDPYGGDSSTYIVKALLNGEVVDESEPVTVWSKSYKYIQLNRPNGGTTEVNKVGSVGKTPVAVYPDGEDYEYFPNDCSVADLDGDGEYEIIVKWDPSNSHDNSYYGITGNVYIDAYKMDGIHLWRIDLGRNVRAGAHYTQLMVYDFDCDGKAEMVCKTAPGTIDGNGDFVIMNNDDPTADYRNLDASQTSGSDMLGIVVKGPEYLTLFDGESGAELHSIAYNPLRGALSSWGDSYGNRSERYLACVAYLNGDMPSVVMCRGYYKRATVSTYNVVNKKLALNWLYDSGSNKPIDATTSAYGQGNHNLSVADVDADGKDEIIWGSSAWDDNGDLLYSIGLGHGDAMHVSDLDPSRPGLEVFSVHEDQSSPYGFEMHDAATGEILWGGYTGTDVGRGMSGDIDPNHSGFESWSGNALYSSIGELIVLKRPSSINFRIYWDGDLQDELLDYTRIQKWDATESRTNEIVDFADFTGATSINSTKANPCLSADILGDWREEVIYYDRYNPSRIILFTTTIPTNYRLFTLMHDPVYRLGVAWQNTAYNQPPHLGFFIGDGIDNVEQPDISIVTSASNDEKFLENSVAVLQKPFGKIQIIAQSPIQSIAIYNTNGIIINYIDEINVSYFSHFFDDTSGLYILKIETETGVVIKKIIR